MIELNLFVSDVCLIFELPRTTELRNAFKALELFIEKI